MLKIYKKFIKSFKKELIGELKKESIEKYAKEVQYFLNWLDHKEIKLDTLEKYKDFLRKKDYKINSINNKLACVSKFSQYLYRINELDKNIKYIPIKTQRKELQELPDVMEYKKMVNRALRDGDYMGACSMAIMFYTGVRVSELIKLKRKDFEENGIVKEFLELEGKGQKLRRIAIPPQLYYSYLKPLFLNEKMKDNDYIFKGENKKHLSRFRINQILKKYASKTRVSLKKATPHKLRHLYALILLEGSQNIETVRQMLGHSTINTTAIYLNQSKNAQYKEVVNAFSDI